MGRGRPRLPARRRQRAGFGKQPKTACSWYVQIKDGKFVLYPNKNPIKGKLIEASLNG